MSSTIQKSFKQYVATYTIGCTFPRTQDLKQTTKAKSVIFMLVESLNKLSKQTCKKLIRYYRCYISNKSTKHNHNYSLKFLSKGIVLFFPSIVLAPFTHSISGKFVCFFFLRKLYFFPVRFFLDFGHFIFFSGKV